MQNKKRTYRFRIILMIVVGLIILRCYLPLIVKNYLNHQLSKLEGYSGSIEDVDIALYRGAYSVEGFQLYSNENKDHPIVKIEDADLSISWKEIFNGAIVGEVFLKNPSLYFINGIGDEKRNNYDNLEKAGWKELVKNLLPIKINRLDIQDGDLYYQDLSTSPQVELKMDHINGVVDNLTNSKGLSNNLVANMDITGMAMSTSKLTIKIAFNPLDTTGTFKSTFEMEELPLTTLNSFLKGYLDIDAESGSISIYSELDAYKGNLKGYVKPLVHQAQFLSVKKGDKNDSLLSKVKEGMYDAGTYLFKNYKENQIASKIIFEGTVNDPQIKVLKAMGSFLHNAFIKAIRPNLEPSLIKK